jgi:hypothetical protein
VEVAEKGEADEGRVFTQGNHMGGDGRAEAGDGDEEAGICSFFRWFGG